ncbi:CLUMA_CG012638, isoform A [Clunio marinus]|uniref:CLUMA_CG012638, isoform A n=1 Tax=Clunio marinus TaxID=568069 RepID=A0A1J1IGP8_9DIPT|nr:CLUMA_CG012638, isoform A [Clunio marinus]
MLVAPIFHNNYLSTKQSESQNNDAVSTSVQATDSSSSKYNNIFKTAFTRGITFLSKIANSSASNTPTTSTSVGSKPTEYESNQDSNSSSDTSSNCSSPDSLKTEMIFFKPITREPKTPSSFKSVLLRVPSIRSTSSTDCHISSPCPSPFFIPIIPRRQSAFSLVGNVEDEFKEKQKIIKPKPTKRKSIKTSPSKHGPSSKRPKRDILTLNKLALHEQVPKKTVKTTHERKTRSMNKCKESSTENNCHQTIILPLKKTLPKPSKPSHNTPIKKMKEEVVTKSTRVTRSQNMKQ